MSGEPGLIGFVASGLARVLTFGLSSRGSGGGEKGHHERTPAWPDDPRPTEREQEERLRELQVLMAHWM